MVASDLSASGQQLSNSSPDFGLRPARLSASLITAAPSSTTPISFRAPPNAPIAVLAPLTTTTSFCMFSVSFYQNFPAISPAQISQSSQIRFSHYDTQL